MPTENSVTKAQSGCKCILILSEKSSGSSAFQNLLAKFAEIRHVDITRHGENETLYWTKAASVLGMPQRKMVDSEVPIHPDRAAADLFSILADNVPGFEPQLGNKAGLFEGWRRLCMHYAPVFIEKSPHHLCQWSALELIIDCTETIVDVDFLIVGLIRNPMDVVYSQFQRWRSRPEQVEQQWSTAYRNLLELQKRNSQRLVIIRYEDMVKSLSVLTPVFEFCDVVPSIEAASYLHQRSTQKWKTDPLFGFDLSNETKHLAKQFGYEYSEMTNSTHLLWPLSREVSRGAFKVRQTISRLVHYVPWRRRTIA